MTTISFKDYRRPPLFFNFRGGLLSSLFSKNPSKFLKIAIFPLKPQEGLKPTEIAVLRHFEGFVEKSEESRPPEKLKNNGGPLSMIFL